MRALTDHLAGMPKKLFLTDGIGAMLTAFFLFIIMRQFNEYFGMPQTILTCLSVIAICLCIYSTLCFLFLKEFWITFLIILGMANLLYAALTTGMLIIYYPQLTLIGLIYFLIEIVMICGLAYIEFNVATEIRKRIGSYNKP